MSKINVTAAELRALAERARGIGTLEAFTDVALQWAGLAEKENESLRAERDDLRDVLLRDGFVPCDIPACNCGSWHHRYGLPERMRDIEDTLAEAGHELSNANGNLPINALKALVAERDELRRQLADMRAALAAAMEIVHKERVRIAYNAKGAPPSIEIGYADILRRLDAVIAQADAALGTEG